MAERPLDDGAPASHGRAIATAAGVRRWSSSCGTNAPQVAIGSHPVIPRLDRHVFVVCRMGVVRRSLSTRHALASRTDTDGDAVLHAPVTNSIYLHTPNAATRVAAVKAGRETRSENSLQRLNAMGNATRGPWLLFAALSALVVLLYLPIARAQNDTDTIDPFSGSPSSPPIAVNDTADVNPFADDDARVCCCQLGNTSTYVAYQYQDQSTAPSTCCCGTPGKDCPDLCGSSTSFSSVCGSGQVCGVLLLMAALIGTLAVTICITGVFLARRRRQRANIDQFILGSAQTGRGSVQRVNVVQIPDEQLKDLEIKDKTIDRDFDAPGSRPSVDEELGGGPQTECPICLEAIEHGVISEFPCGHKCCRECRDDLVHHSSRVVNAAMVAILCPLCRKLAVAPSPVAGISRNRSCQQRVIVIQTIVDEQERADEEHPQDTATVDVVEQRADAEADEEALATTNDRPHTRVE